MKNFIQDQKWGRLLLAFCFYVLIIVPSVACSDRTDNNVKPQHTYVLVHGAWQAPYVWDDVKATLEKNGNKVIVVELPAHGADTTSPASVTINVYRDKVLNAINSANGKVILVGHSMGGMVVTAVAEAQPDRIEKLVYIGAFLPANGQSLLALASQDATSLLGPNLIPSADHLTLDVNRSQIINIFCQDASADKQKEVLDNFRVEPAIPFTNNVSITAANFGKVNKYYIYTAQDHAISLDNQKKMVSAAGITQTFTLNSSHCPFLSMPDKVSDLLLQIGK